MSERNALDALHDTAVIALRGMMRERERLGYRMDGRFCLDCGMPLFTAELLHRPPPGPMSTIDQIRWAGVRDRYFARDRYA